MKMYVFDASALFAFLQNKPGAPRINEILKEAIRGRADVSMSSVNYGEVYGRILRDYGQEQARNSMQAVNPLPLEIVDVTLARAKQAADVKFQYKLYYVDSFAAALALERKGTLVTSDSDFRKVGQSVPVLWLKS